MKYFIYSLMFILSSCTYNISMAHTEGSAEDVIDDTASNSPDVSPKLNVPFGPGGLGFAR